MLILTRRIGEQLKIGDNISITVLGQSGSQIQLGITAPAEINILREEVHRRNLQSANSALAPVTADSDEPA